MLLVITGKKKKKTINFFHVPAVHLLANKGYVFF